MAKKTDDFPLIKSQIEAGTYAPVYVLHGEEGFFIDQLTDLLLDRVVPEEARDFDLVQFFAGSGSFTTGDVIAACRRFPMVAERQLVLLREAQVIDKRTFHLDDLCAYVKHPSPSTIFVITCKGAALTGATELLKLCRKAGVVYASDKVRDYELPRVLPGFLQSLGVTAEPKAIEMLCDYVGSDFSRLTREVDKLRLTMQGRKQITVADVADHVGISREFNVYELVDAVAKRNALRVETIRRYFERNPKAGPSQMVIAALFAYFQNMMLGFYCKDRTINGLMSQMGCSYPQAKSVVDGMKTYSARIAMRNITILREYDARSKGGRGGTTPDPELLQELFYQLMH